jgi:uncharacterized protein
MNNDMAYRLGSTGEHRLQRQYDTEARADKFYSQQVLDCLNPRMREFIERQEMMFIATADARGECDSSFRAGPPGFIRVLDEHTLVYPEYRGNGVMASLGNISENGHIGLLMIDFFRDIIGLHINGRARIIEDTHMRLLRPDLPMDTVAGRRPERWIVVSVVEAYIHCSKHIPRLAPIPRNRHWGTDDIKRKGGDFFNTKDTPKP